MRIPFRLLLVALMLTNAGAALSAEASKGRTPGSMSEEEMSRAFGGRTLEGHYASGTPFVETYHANGRIDYRETDRTMGGRWLVRAGTFCTLYDTSPTGGCYRVQRKGDNCFEFYFVARDEREADSGGGPPSWTAQGWVKDKPTTCREQPTV